MRVELAYGRHGLEIEVPDGAAVVLPRQEPGLPDEEAALRSALRRPLGCPPLRKMVRADQRVVIVFNDITRPVPSARILPVLLGELAHVPRENIVLLNALGTHRANTAEELQEILGAAIADGYTVAQHDAWDEEGLVELGRTSYGHRAAVNRLYYEADVRILTGFIEPHFFAGFSGGPKVVMPGIAGIDTIMNNHGYAMLREPSATWGRTEGNPVWEEIRQVASLAPPDLILNVTLNRRREITRVFAGELWRAHRAGVDYARETAMAPVEAPYDVVITTNSGYPLDINLYQAVKGMSCAAQIVKPGGAIILAAECRDGIPDYGEYRAIVQEAGSVAGIMEMIRQPDFRRHDQWEAQLQARVQERAKVYVYSDYLSDEQTRSMLLEPIESIETSLAALLEEHGPDARLCVLPEGPQTIPYLVQNGEIS